MNFWAPASARLFDLVTVAILWFAGASALAGLLNLVPLYLPRYGMAPEWARATRPLVVIFTGIGILVTIVFSADVDAQAGAYATGVLVLMTSGAVAVAITAWRQSSRWALFMSIAVVFIYTGVTNMIERPEGIKIASVFIISIVVDVAGVPHAAVDRVARARHRTGSPRPAVHRRRGARRRDQHHRQPARPGRPERVRGQAARGAADASSDAGRSGAVSGGRAGRCVGVQRSAAGARRSRGRLLRPARQEPGDSQRDRRAPAATSAIGPARFLTCTSDGPKATRSRTC